MSGSEEHSELPQDIIRQIVSSLIYKELLGKEAILCSLVSRDFFSAINKRHILFFDYDAIHKDADLLCADYEKRYKEELNYLLSTLARYKRENIDLDTFTFRTDPSLEVEGYEREYYKCMRLAFERGLRRLDISLNGDEDMHSDITKLKSLEHLRLSACRLWTYGTEWCNLKELAMDNVLMEEELTFEYILKTCLNIQDLKIRHCSWDLPEYNFLVSDCPSLKRLAIQLTRHQTFELNAVPNLESLACCYGIFRDALTEMSCSEHQNLRSLSLQFAGINENFFDDFAEKFPMLEELSIKYNRSLERLAISSSSIKKIELLEFEALQEAHFDVPNLVIFKFESPNNGQNTMLPSLSFSGDSSGWISCIQIVESSAIVNASWFLKLSKFLAALNRSVISVSVLFRGPVLFSEAHSMIEDSDSVTDIIGDIHKLFIETPSEAHSMIPDSSPVTEILGEIQEFRIETAGHEFSLTYAKVVLDGIFWICRPQSITFRHLGKIYGSTDTEDHPRFEHSVKYSGDVSADKMFRHRCVDVNEGLGLELPPESNCGAFLELLEAHAEKQFTVGFSVDY